MEQPATQIFNVESDKLEPIVSNEGPEHDCMTNAVPCKTDGPLGHGWECGVCGEFLQAG